MTVYTIRKILVPVDLSESSLNALDTAVALAKKNNAELVILNVEENYSDNFYNESSYAVLSSNDVLAALAGNIQHKTNITVNVLSEDGCVTDNIIRTSLSQQTDLIVMGSHGASGFRDGYLGSNTYSVMKHSVLPVLAIPNTRKYTTFRKILFPVRPVTGALKRYDIISQLVNGNATLFVLGISPNEVSMDTKVLDKLVDEIRPGLDHNKVKNVVSWGSGETIPDEVINYAQQTAPDLVAITSLVDATTKPKFIGPYTQKIINSVKTPILSIKKIGVPTLEP
jgi:nucleotide-binding universal stress UspA family protein